MTTKGVSIKPNELHRPIASAEDLTQLLESKKKMRVVSKVRRALMSMTIYPTTYATTMW